MADMYTTLNACRSYLYMTAQAVDRNFVSNKVSESLFVPSHLNSDLGLRWCDSVLRGESDAGVSRWHTDPRR